MDPNLLSYIANYLQQGYDPAAIEQTLVQQGYKKKDIDKAFKQVYAQNYQSGVQVANKGYQHFHITKTEAIAGGALTVVVAIIILLAFSFIETAPVPSDNFIPVSDPVEEVFERPDPVEQEVDQEPELEAVIPEETRELEPEQEEPRAPTITELAAQQSNQRVLSRLEIDTIIQETAPTNPGEAASYCSQIITENGENDCYANVAVLAEDDSYCQFISNEKQLDFCFMQFVIDGIGSEAICSKIKSQLRRETCVQLLTLQNTAQQFEATIEYSPEAAELAYVDTTFSGGDVVTTNTTQQA